MKLKKKSRKFQQFTPIGELTPWKPCLFQERCECYRPFLFKKLNSSKSQSNRTILSEGRAIKYPENLKTKNLKFLKTFQIQYEGRFSLLGECILSNFQNKYIYYAIDDILYLLKSNLNERENLLELFYSSMFSLHNDFSINFFDIWIDSICINHIYKNNRFVTSESEKVKHVTYITLRLSYVMRSPIKKPESIW